MSCESFNNYYTYDKRIISCFFLIFYKYWIYNCITVPLSQFDSAHVFLSLKGYYQKPISIKSRYSFTSEIGRWSTYLHVCKMWVKYISCIKSPGLQVKCALGKDHTVNYKSCIGILQTTEPQTKHLKPMMSTATTMQLH